MFVWIFHQIEQSFIEVARSPIVQSSFWPKSQGSVILRAATLIYCLFSHDFVILQLRLLPFSQDFVRHAGYPRQYHQGHPLEMKTQG